MDTVFLSNARHSLYLFIIVLTIGLPDLLFAYLIYSFALFLLSGLGMNMISGFSFCVFLVLFGGLVW